MSHDRVLLIHSGGFTSRQWRKLAEQLAPSHRVLAPDLIGYGDEPWPAGKPFHFHQDLELLSTLLAAEPGPLHLVGHSYGGLLALKLALTHRAELRSLSVFEPVAFGVLRAEGESDADADAAARSDLRRVEMRYQLEAQGADTDWLAQFVDWWNGPGAWAALAPETQASFKKVGWKLFQEVVSLMTDTTGEASYRTIAAPALVMGGDRSPEAERRVLIRLAESIPGASLRIFPAMGHMGPITHAALVNAAIVEHIRAAHSDGSSA